MRVGAPSHFPWPSGLKYAVYKSTLLLQIELFLPVNQRLNGALEAYHSGYNLAIVTVKGLLSICPEDIKPHPEPFSPRTVVAIGCDPEGLLCA
jgi:hypothetical protein